MLPPWADMMIAAARNASVTVIVRVMEFPRSVRRCRTSVVSGFSRTSMNRWIPDGVTELDAGVFERVSKHLDTLRNRHPVRKQSRPRPRLAQARRIVLIVMREIYDLRTNRLDAVGGFLWRHSVGRNVPRHDGDLDVLQTSNLRNALRYAGKQDPLAAE